MALTAAYNGGERADPAKQGNALLFVEEIFLPLHYLPQIGIFNLL
jgi:hypothetical protein